MLNMSESKPSAQNNVTRLRELIFVGLLKNMLGGNQEYKAKQGFYTYEQFADIFLKRVACKVNSTKKILTILRRRVSVIYRFIVTTE